MTPPDDSSLASDRMGWRYASQECDAEVSTSLLRTFLDRGHREVDTALAYAGGETERMLGEIFSKHPELLARASIATKANPWPGGNMTSSAGEGGLEPSQLRAQVTASREALAPGAVDLLYLHAPDSATPIEETLRELKALHEEGAWKQLGLSNFPAWEVVHVYHKCLEMGMPPPSAYQGMYNCVTRACEPELLPALRKLNVRFLAYNPLAGGLLTGKHASYNADANAESDRGRFVSNKMYQDRFWKREYFSAAELIKNACQTADPDGTLGLTPASAALRWMYSHSQLDGGKGDAVILGASSVAHLTANLDAAERATNGEPLPRIVLDAIEDAAAACAAATPQYSRGHSKIASR